MAIALISQKKELLFFKIKFYMGWATWRRAWKKLDLKMSGYKKMKEKNLIKKYYENTNIFYWMDEYFKKTLDNKDKIWSTYWSFTIAKNKALCISPFKILFKI